METAQNASSGANVLNVRLSPTKTPGYVHADGLTEESAQKTSELLTINSSAYHTYWNDNEFHDHISHHLFTLWATGASPKEIQTAYDQNKTYQLPLDYHLSDPVGVAERLESDPKFFAEVVGNGRYYHAFLIYFRRMIERQGEVVVIKERLFKDDDASVDLLGRMYSGFVHPLIHFGFAIEFKQPCILAESLASICSHDNWSLRLMLPIEAHLKAHPDTPRASLIEIVHELQASPTIRTAVKSDDPPNRITDGLFKRALSELIPIFAKWRVEPTQESIDFHLAEMINVAVYTTVAPQKPGKVPMIDFFLLHSANSSVFYPAFMDLPYLSLEQKARLLNWKAYTDLAMYAACGSPDLYLDRITEYKPTHANQTFTDINARANAYEDDGHLVKLIRALFATEKLSKPYDGQPEFPLPSSQVLRAANLVMDSVEANNKVDIPDAAKEDFYALVGGKAEGFVQIVARWVRWSGLEGAWDGVPDLGSDKREAGATNHLLQGII